MMKFEPQALTLVFLVALAAEAATRLWLGSRQIAALTAHRDQVPELFRGQIALADQQKAADYTVARARLGRWATLIEAAIKIALTVGGGIAAVDAALRPVRLPEPWHGALVVMSVLILLQVLELPVELWRTFGVEARFGFNRISPRLFIIDVGKRLLLALIINPLWWIGVVLLLVPWPLRMMQLARRERRRGLSTKLAWASGILLMVGKLPQFLGLVGFHFDRLSGRASRLIEYKHRGTA